MEEKKFILKHKNINVIELWLDYKFEISSCGIPINIEHMPVGTIKNGKVNLIKLNTFDKSNCNTLVSLETPEDNDMLMKNKYFNS